MKKDNLFIHINFSPISPFSNHLSM